MSDLSALKPYFQTGTTEGELQLLEQAFVFDTAFAKAAAPPVGSPRLLIGKKGAGKTALVEYLRLKLQREGIPVVTLRPDDFDTSALGTTADLATIKRATFAFVTLAVASRLDAENVLATGHKKVLNAAAKAYDKGKIDSIQKLLTVLKPVGKAVSGIDFEAMLPSNVPHPRDIAAAIKSELGTGSVAYLFIDDTDQIGAPREANYLSRIWGLLLGVRKLASDAPNLKCLLTLRSEVWRRLQWDGLGQRDQVDHFRPLAVEWVPDDQQIVRIWKRRLELAAPESVDPVLHFFEEDTVQLPGTEDQERRWPIFLAKNARQRPRDMVQFMSKLIDSAIKDSAKKISSKHMLSVIGEYSAERVEYLGEEFAQDCDSLKDIVRTLAKLPNVSDAEAFLRHVRGIPSSFRVSIRAKTLQGDARDDAFVLWRLLHEAGVVNALVPDARMQRGFRHINYADDPGLVNISRWNEMQKAQWEIHPAFRSYIQHLRDSDAAADGITSREVLTRRK